MRVSAILLALLSFSSVWAAGPITSGGGFAVVCRSNPDTIKSAGLLDLYEGRMKHRLVPRPSTGKMDLDYIEAVRRTYVLQGGRPDITGKFEIQRHFFEFFESVRFTLPGQKVPPTGDLGPVVPAPAGCRFEQLARFDDRKNEIMIDSEIWGALAPIDQAALVSHELFYHQARTANARDSANTRALVAQIYSNEGVVPAHEGIPKSAKYHFTGKWGAEPESDFYAWTESGGTYLQFASRVFGLPLVSKTAVFLPGIEWNLAHKFTPPDSPFSVVAQPNTRRVVKAKVMNQFHRDREIEVLYVTGQPVRMRLLEKGRPVKVETVMFAFGH